jgi:hypothetical protein
MNVTGKFLLGFLCISIASYGLSGSVSASNHNLLPLTVATNSDSYTSGDLILIFGSIRDYDGGYPTVTIQVSDPKENRVHLCQVEPKLDGTFNCTTTASARWSTGEYNVKAMWNYQPAYATFEFVGGAAPEPVNEAAAEAEAAAAAAAAAVIEAEPEIEPEPMMTSQPAEEKKGGGCLIATAAFGSEMAPQVQFLREIRDNTVLQTESGSAFMTGFNQFYYSFSPAVADYERENPAFKETVKFALTPMLASLAILNYVDIDSEAEMLGYGIGIILLNIGMYFVAPAIIIIKIKNRN